LNHHLTRIGLGCLGAASIGSFLAAAYPRIYAWNEASTAATIATQRAANCRLLDGPVQANTIPIDSKTKRPLSPGVHVCYWDGSTGQINGTGAIDFVRQGSTESIANILKSRGFKQS
jgi:hypothetical protein